MRPTPVPAPSDSPSDSTTTKRRADSELERGGLAYYVACLRELFEEAGLLVVCDARRRSRSDSSDDATIDRLAVSRRDVNAGTLDFLDMLEREGLRAGPSRISSTWRTG